MFSMLYELMNDQAGATAIEYGLIVALVSVAAIAGFSALGNKIGETMNMVAANLTR
jgi:pilus assembly protein Flp/PilA